MPWLLAGLLTVHFVGDFTVLSTARMQESKATGGPVGWIFAHGAVHGILALLPLLVFTSAPSAFTLASVVAVSHFAIDLVRSRLGTSFPALSDPAAKPFWTALGFDQLLHALVLVWISSQAL